MTWTLTLKRLLGDNKLQTADSVDDCQRTRIFQRRSMLLRLLTRVLISRFGSELRPFEEDAGAVSPTEQQNTEMRDESCWV